MKWLLISVIHIYRWLPRCFKRTCLFKETCSAHVLRLTRESGFWAGVRSLRSRMLQCRTGYVVLFDGNVSDWVVRLANGSVASRDELADSVIEPYMGFSLCVRRH